MRTKPAPPAESNLAVLRCWKAWRKAYDETLAQGGDNEDADGDAGIAYREAMPPLDGIENTGDFIACLTHGCLIGAIDASEYSRHLYAVQVVHTTSRTGEPKAKNGVKKSHSDPDFAPETALFTPPNPRSEPSPEPCLKEEDAQNQALAPKGK